MSETKSQYGLSAYFGLKVILVTAFSQIIRLGKTNMEIVVICLIICLHTSAIKAAYECVAGTWGSQCSFSCGFCEGGPEFCQVYDGLCVNGCASGYKGKMCKDKCEAGTHGHYCHSVCGECSSAKPECHHVTGQCMAGCKPGFQPPLCKFPCQFNTWGKNCDQSCDCDTANETCGCDPGTGTCLTCGPDGKPQSVQAKVSDKKCLNQDILDDYKGKYVAPSVLNLPYKPVMGAISVVGSVVLTNFIYWFIMVRNRNPKPPPPPIIRGEKKPKNVPHHEILYKTVQKAGDPDAFMVRGIERHVAVLKENLPTES